MGKSQRDKGKRGQREFAEVLQARGWEIMASSEGAAMEDFLGIAPDGKVFAIEVKNHRLIDLGKFLPQARQQAARRKRVEWLLACRLAGYPMTFLVLASDGTKAVWDIESTNHGNTFISWEG